MEDFSGLCEGSDCGVYPCLNPFAAEWVDHRAINSYTTNPVNFNRRVFFSEEQIRGLTRNYYQWGADGIYSFNFCCEAIDNPDWVRRTHEVVKESTSDRGEKLASYLFLPIWRHDWSPSGGEQSWRTIRIERGDSARAALKFRVADGRDDQSAHRSMQGRLRFRVYNLHESEGLDLDINGTPIPDDAMVERRKTNIHVAADRRYPGMHIPPHISFEIDLARCPSILGDSEVGFVF